MRMMREPTHDLVLISDSNVRPAPGYLARLVSEMDDPEVALVSSTLVGVGRGGLGTTVENLMLNTFIAASIGAAHTLDIPCTVGKSLLLRRSRLDELGGLAAVGDVLAEDYCLGRMFDEAGHGVALCRDPLPVVHSRRSLREAVSRHLRWTQMRRVTTASAFAAEPLLNPLPLVVLATVCGPAAASYLWLGLAAKYALDAILVRRLRGHALSVAELALLPARDALLTVFWLIAVFRRRVTWRGRELMLGEGSRLLPVPPSRWARRRRAEVEG
jgi:ceramide glucosyltransferase